MSITASLGRYGMLEAERIKEERKKQQAFEQGLMQAGVNPHTAQPPLPPEAYAMHQANMGKMGLKETAPFSPLNANLLLQQGQSGGAGK